jgi:hypothetical protein
VLLKVSIARKLCVLRLDGNLLCPEGASAI